MMQSLRESSLKPMYSLRSRNDLHFRPGLVQQRPRFQAALPAADDEDPLSLEATKITVFTSVRHECGRKTLKFRRAPGEGAYANGNDYPAGIDHFAIIGGEAETF